MITLNQYNTVTNLVVTVRMAYHMQTAVITTGITVIINLNRLNPSFWLLTA